MLLELKNIVKKFGEVEVLKGVIFRLQAGEVLGLVGENGAGKSTLMNILGGIHQPTAGEMVLRNEAFAPRTPNESLNAGIAFIHQELNLFPNLSVFENLFINNFPNRKMLGLSFIDRKAVAAKAEQLLKQVGLEVGVGTLVESLSPAQKQLLEIAKALSSIPWIIIFDEPTTALTRHESDKLFDLMQELKSNDIAMIYISHNLEDVMQISDEIAVLRDGALINSYRKEDGFSMRSIVGDMVGRDMGELFPPRHVVPVGETLLEVKGMSVPPIINAVSFSACKGEVLGFYGLVGAGRSEVARCIYGLDSFEDGELLWRGTRIEAPSPSKWIDQRVAFLTEDRREEGLLLDQNIEKNIALAGLSKFARTFLRCIKRSDMKAVTEEKAKATRIKYHSLETQNASTLSGGNQQKVVLSKWLLVEPELLIVDEPTKGIDIGAKHEIYGLINDLVEKGAGVVLISSEIEELLGMCDRILVMNRGRISAEFAKNEFDRRAILKAALHVEGELSSN